jgi:hypothetical protein
MLSDGGNESSTLRELGAAAKRTYSSCSQLQHRIAKRRRLYATARVGADAYLIVANNGSAIRKM